MRTEQEASGTGMLTKDGTARPTPPFRTRLAELVGRTGQRLWRAQGRVTPVAVRPVADDDHQERVPTRGSGSTLIVAGAALAIMGLRRKPKPTNESN